MSDKNTYLVIGAMSDGIGEAVTNRLLNDGHNVIGTYDVSQKEKAESFSSIDSIKLYEVDHSAYDSLQSFCDSICSEKINGIVNVYMYFHMESPDKYDHNEWEKSIFINLLMPNYLINNLKSTVVDGGSIVAITSTEGFVGSFGASAYSSTKAAIHNLVMTHANNLGERNIRVNALAAGWIGGVMDTDEVFNMSREITPLGRLGSPDEVASATNFLLSSESSFVNGTVLTVDGGYRGVDSIAKYEFKTEFPNN